MIRIKNKDKPSNCEGCNLKFGDELKYHSRGRCNRCYQKAYLDKDYVKEKYKTNKTNTHCVECSAEFGTKNDKGKNITKGAKGHCKRCYMRLFLKRATNTCNGCGNEMIAKRLSLCPLCKQKESSAKKWKRKERLPHIVDDETFELIRRLLVRYKIGHNNFADAFRVADVYMDISDNTNLLDNLREDYQIVEMLRWLKTTFDYNIQFVKSRHEAEVEKIKLDAIRLERKIKFAKKKEKI